MLSECKGQQQYKSGSITVQRVIRICRDEKKTLKGSYCMCHNTLWTFLLSSSTEQSHLPSLDSALLSSGLEHTYHVLGIHAVYVGLLPVVVHYWSSDFCQRRFYKCELINRASGVRKGERGELQILGEKRNSWIKVHLWFFCLYTPRITNQDVSAWVTVQSHTSCWFSAGP